MASNSFTLHIHNDQVMILILAILLLVSQVIAAPVVTLERRGLQWDYQNDKIRGVNLGGWFVLEPYITPSLFEGWSNGLDDLQTPVDEYTYCKKLGKSLAHQRLDTHWKTWYTEADFKQIKALGLNAVRIPIGYWAFALLDDDPYVQGQEAYLDQALEWCRKHGLYAWVDLHGAPGSQNGFDNSGLRDSYKFQEDTNVKLTLDVLKQIGLKYGASDYEDVVIGIQLLNEPLGPVLNMDDLKKFFTDAYSEIRESDGQKLYNAVVFHDSFQQTPHYWDDFMQVSGGYWNVVVDHHHYQVFSQADLERLIKNRTESACAWGAQHKDEAHWNVVGEWSAAMTDCAKWLNGVGHGARLLGDYDGSKYIDSCSSYADLGNWSETHRTNTIKYVEAQMDAWEHVAGWFYWCWKTEDAVEWDFQRLLAAGIIPSPLDSRQYPNQCNY